MVCLGAFLRLSVTLALHWNSAVHVDPLPFSVSAVGAIYLAELASTNLHLSSLLLALSRSPGDGRGGDWYSPVTLISLIITRGKSLENTLASVWQVEHSVFKYISISL